MSESPLPAIRRAMVEDAPACAAILNAWIDGEDWMPRVHDHDDVVRHYREFVLQKRLVWAIGDPIEGYIAVDPDEGFVTSLFVAKRGEGRGRLLLDRAKEGRQFLQLWTFVANDGAQRFYKREGFREVQRTDGDNEEGLPDILFRWDAGA